MLNIKKYRSSKVDDGMIEGVGVTISNSWRCKTHDHMSLKTKEIRMRSDIGINASRIMDKHGHMMKNFKEQKK